uniref:Uncharacterized protein n=1 Tax=Oncorhynchus tshawytscha TaxID=74940 RepID=A0A8C8GAI3_ONCTS
IPINSPLVGCLVHPGCSVRSASAASSLYNWGPLSVRSDYRVWRTDMNSESTSGKLSATATLTLTVAERAGCPLSSTTTVSLCFTASLSLTWRIVLISPFCKPTSNSALSVAFCSLYESQAFCPESTSTATTLVTR